MKMKKTSYFKTLIVFFVFHIVFSLANITSAQIVPNGSFEDNSSTPIQYSQIHLAVPWISATTDGTPDYYHRNASLTTDVYIPRHATHRSGFQDTDAGEGDAYSGIFIGEEFLPLQQAYKDNWEYISMPLEFGGLDPAKSYTISFKVNKIDSTITGSNIVKPSIDVPIGGISAFLFNSTTYPGLVLANRNTGAPLSSYLNYSKTFEISNSTIIQDETEWTIVTGQIPVRPNGEVLNHLIIGSFLSEADLRSKAGILIPSDPVGTYVFIDEVQIVENVTPVCDCEDIEFSMTGLGPANPSCKQLDISMPSGCQNMVQEISVTVQGDVTTANKGGVITNGAQPGSEIITWDRDIYSGKYQFCFSGSSIGSILFSLMDDHGNEICRKMINCTCNGYEWTLTRNHNTPDSSCCYNYHVKRITENACEIYGFGIQGDVDNGDAGLLSPTPILNNVGDSMTLGTICFNKSETSVDLQLYGQTPDPWNGYNIICSTDYELEDCPEACCNNITVVPMQSSVNNPDCIDVMAIFGPEACNINTIRVIDNISQSINTFPFNPVNDRQQLGTYCCSTEIVDLVIHFLDAQENIICHKILNTPCNGNGIPTCCDSIEPIITSIPPPILTPPGSYVHCCWDYIVPWDNISCNIGGWMLIEDGDPIPQSMNITSPLSNHIGELCSEDSLLIPILPEGESEIFTLHLNKLLAIYDINGDLLCTMPLIDSCALTYSGPTNGGGSGKPGKRVENNKTLNEVIKNTHYFRVAPNPTDNRASIYYSILGDAHVHLTLYNTIGQIIQTIESEPKTKGEYKVDISIEDLPSGIYYIKLQAGNETLTIPLKVMK